MIPISLFEHRIELNIGDLCKISSKSEIPNYILLTSIEKNSISSGIYSYVINYESHFTYGPIYALYLGDHKESDIKHRIQIYFKNAIYVLSTDSYKIEKV